MSVAFRSDPGAVLPTVLNELASSSKTEWTELQALWRVGVDSERTMGRFGCHYARYKDLHPWQSYLTRMRCTAAWQKNLKFYGCLLYGIFLQMVADELLPLLNFKSDGFYLVLCCA